MKKAKWLLICLVMAICIVSVGAYASNGTVNKTLSYNNIKITLDGKTLTPTDAGGNYVEPFIIEGTTYLPVRGISSALGLNVDWDANTKTVKLSTKGNSAVSADNLYSDLKNWLVKNGTVNGDYVYFSKSADNYGGSANNSFSVTYWGDTDTVEVSLLSVLDDEYSIRYFIEVPKTFTGKYEYTASYYYRATGEEVMCAQGYINSATFNQNSPLENTSYYGDKSLQNDFMELARLGACSTLNCFDEFLTKEKTGYTLQSIGFKNF